MISDHVLVTGGTGFIGSWLVQRLAQETPAQIRVLLRSYTSASRIARFPIEMARGDILSREDLRKAMTGCKTLFHCAYGNSGDDTARRKANIDGTRNVLEVAAETGVERVVYLSTLDVYGIPRDGDLDETSPLRSFGRPYSDTKREAEEFVREFMSKQKLPVVVLQPTIVYGPFAPVWTSDLLNIAREGHFLLIDGGEGLCNPVFIDDLVSAMLLAAEESKAVGEVFLISGNETVTWREFYGGFQAITGDEAMVNMSADEAMAYYRKGVRSKRLPQVFRRLMQEYPPVRERLLQTPELGAVVRAVKSLTPSGRWQDMRAKANAVAEAAPPRRPPTPHPPDQIRYYQAKMRVRIDKARRLLGYDPVFSFADGMRVTAEWARWANRA